jgi:hypothetical protein
VAAVVLLETAMMRPFWLPVVAIIWCFHSHQKIAICAMVATLSGADNESNMMISTAQAEGLPTEGTVL